MLLSGGATVTGLALAGLPSPASAAVPSGARAEQDASVRVLYPRARVPVSFIIDDSTCLVNMGHYCMPQFATAWPKRKDYRQPWKTWPREIPDTFVRSFGEWCSEHGVKGKYSVVPYPACVGWLDRELPGWSRRELQESLKLVRELLMPGWDIHPEMITHTRVIDLRTGRPFEEITAATMENWYPREKKSVDELAAYLAYALRILKNCGLPCEGITTPGGFGNMVKPELGLAVHQSVREVFGAEIPHYFKYVVGGSESTHPKPEHVKGLNGPDPHVVMNVPAATGDWFGGWTGDRDPEPDRYANRDATSGRMVELIEKDQPAIMLCHWPGLYSHGTERGFRSFQRVVTSLEGRFKNRMHWMKVSELARYGAARELTQIKCGQTISLKAPFACPLFTLKLEHGGEAHPTVHVNERPLALVQARRDLKAGTWWKDGNEATLCFDLPKGRSEVSLV